MRKSRRRTKADTDTTRRCRMCGTTVGVDDTGRCRLGHHVGLPLAPKPAPEPGPVAAAPLPAAPPAPPVAGLPPVPPPAAPAPPLHTTMPAGHARADQDPAQPGTPDTDRGFAHPYDEVLAWEPPPARAPAGQPAPQSGGDLRSAIDELLSWDDAAPSALDVSAAELPAPQPPAAQPRVPARTEFTDEESEAAAEETSRRRLATLLGGGALAVASGFVAALVGLPL